MRRAEAPYLYNAETKTFITYNDAGAEAFRAVYVRKMGLGGTMFWQYGGDSGNVLLDAIVAGVSEGEIADFELRLNWSDI